jgi:hypothetical protein
LPPAKPQSHAGRLGTRSQVHAIPYLAVSGDLQRNYSLSADLSLKEMPANRGLFYTDWLSLGKLYDPDHGMVGVGLDRWKRFHYRPVVAYTWVTPAGNLVYQDSSLVLDERPHRYALGAVGDRLFVKVDGRELCYGSQRAFFGDRPTLSYDIGGELVHMGDRIDGTATHIRVKRDHDVAPRANTFRCAQSENGLHWIKIGTDAYRVVGTENRTGPSFADVIPGGCNPSG